MKSQLINYEVALALITALSLIAQVNAQASCSPSSPQCCWVVRLWELMKAATTVSSSSATACCSSPGRIPGVVCSGSTVLELNWGGQSLKNSIPSDIGKLVNLKKLDLRSNQLSGPIPSEIGNMTKLQYLWLRKNKLSGPIPASIGNLKNLQILTLWSNQFSGPIPEWIGNMTELQLLNLGSNQFSGPIPEWIGNLTKLQNLYLAWNQLSGSIPKSIGKLPILHYLYVMGNSDLTGTFTPRCAIEVFAAHTNITICGCASASAPPVLIPPPGTTPECLATGVSSLSKRAQVYSNVLALSGKQLTFTCDSDTMGNPYQNCLNTLTYLCSSTHIVGNNDRISTCKNSVDQIFSNLNQFWKDLPTICAPWKGGSPSSEACNTRNAALISGAFYTLNNGDTVGITLALTESIKERLWSNQLLA